MSVCRYDHGLLGFGKWGNVDDAAAMILKKLNSWMIRRPEYLWEYMAYVCPACGYVMRGSQVGRAWLFKPIRCPLHGITMTRYTPELVEEDSKLFEKFRDLLAHKLLLLETAAKAYVGRRPEKWYLYLPPTVEVAFGDNPTVFRYAWWRNAIEAYLHLHDHQHEALLRLKNFFVSLGLEFCAEINPHGISAPPPGAIYDEEKDVYRIIAKPF